MDSEADKKKGKVPSSIYEGLSYFTAMLYMRSFGVNIVSLQEIPDSEDVIVKDDKGKKHLIKVANGLIRGCEKLAN